MPSDNDYNISVDQLQIGVYVYLDVGWMKHPFSFNNFKIRNEDQLRTIGSLGLKSVRWDPARSDIKPLARGAVPVPTGAEGPGLSPALPLAALSESKSEGEAAARVGAMMAVKQQHLQRLTEHREKIARVEQAFSDAASVIRGINQTIYSQPERTLREAGQLIGGIVDELLAAPELAIQVMAEKPGSEDVYFHALNVAVLSMILGRELSLPGEVVKMVGVGALFHDIGLNEIPARILNNPDTLTKAEREFREMHCQYGHDVGKKAGLPAAALGIILQHHENVDGTGYPKKLKGEAIDPLARLVAIVNAYDNLCNPVNAANALTPHEALAMMFSQQRSRYDARLLQAFIRFMGVYPPGTVVGLSNDALGLVIQINPARPLKPTVIVYDAGIPKHEALILDLNEESDVNITRAIRPAMLPAAVFDYLSPRKRVSYYFDASSPVGS
jgi:putative nucleotidyltransferase with HDIG domain